MLDVSIRAEILNLLADLRVSRQISIIFITHDLGTVGYFADRVAVMYLGRIVEIGLLKAIGATRRQILTLFLAEASSLSLLGGVIGFGIGQLAAFALRTAYPIIDFRAPVWAAAAGVAVAIASGLIFGILPARRAAALDPVEALAK
jgi:ABC-type antimicrobial peptide transport system permease subunit